MRHLSPIFFCCLFTASTTAYEVKLEGAIVTANAQTMFNGVRPLSIEKINIDGEIRYRLTGRSKAGTLFKTVEGGVYGYGQYGAGEDVYHPTNGTYWAGDIIARQDGTEISRLGLKSLYDIHFGMKVTLDFWWDALGIKSHDNNSSPHYANYGWQRGGGWMVVPGRYHFSVDGSHPDYPATIEYVGHEMGHSLHFGTNIKNSVTTASATSFPFDAEDFADMMGIAVRNHLYPGNQDYRFNGAAADLANRPFYNPRDMRGKPIGDWFYMVSVGGQGNSISANLPFNIQGIGNAAAARIIYQALNAQRQDYDLLMVANSTIDISEKISASTANAVYSAWIAAGIPAREPQFDNFKRTVVLIYGQTSVGQNMFIRGGIDHGYANTVLGRNCQTSNSQCAIPIRYRNSLNATTAGWKNGDKYLDWYGKEYGQSGGAEGSPLDWTTDNWPSSWGTTRTVANDGYGLTPLNTFGQHYWLLDVDMDCSATVDGWFELKSFISNGPGWEGDIYQSGAPYSSKNHFARCGHRNVFKRGQSQPELIAPLQ